MYNLCYIGYEVMSSKVQYAALALRFSYLAPVHSKGAKLAKEHSKLWHAVLAFRT